MGGIDKWKKEDATGTPGPRRICLSDEGGAMAQIPGLMKAGFPGSRARVSPLAHSLSFFISQPIFWPRTLMV